MLKRKQIMMQLYKVEWSGGTEAPDKKLTAESISYAEFTENYGLTGRERIMLANMKVGEQTEFTDLLSIVKVERLA
jgi:hypothetical protein